MWSNVAAPLERDLVAAVQGHCLPDGSPLEHRVDHCSMDSLLSDRGFIMAPLLWLIACFFYSADTGIRGTWL